MIPPWKGKNHIYFGVIRSKVTITINRIFYNPQKKKSAKIKCLLFRPKPQKFHTAEITGYTVSKSEERNQNTE